MGFRVREIWIQIPALPLANSSTLEKSLPISNSPSPHLQNENRRAYHTRPVKNKKQQLPSCLAHSDDDESGGSGGDGHRNTKRLLATMPHRPNSLHQTGDGGQRYFSSIFSLSVPGRSKFD